MKEKSYVVGLSQLDHFASEFLENFARGVVILKGDLAAGKTTFVKTIAKLKGICDDVTSPTFSLQQCYGEDTYHYDIYNKGLDHFIALGISRCKSSHRCRTGPVPSCLCHVQRSSRTYRRR